MHSSPESRDRFHIWCSAIAQLVWQIKLAAQARAAGQAVGCVLALLPFGWGAHGTAEGSTDDCVIRTGEMEMSTLGLFIPRWLLCYSEAPVPNAFHRRPA